MRTDPLGNGEARASELDPVLKWVMTTLVIGVLLILAYTGIFYAAQLDTSSHRLKMGLPSNYRDTVAAMIEATGHSCRRVCDMTASPGSLRVGCSDRPSIEPCTATESYNVTVAPVPAGSR